LSLLAIFVGQITNFTIKRQGSTFFSGAFVFRNRKIRPSADSGIGFALFLLCCGNG